MTLRNAAGQVLNQTEILALTTDVTPPADPVLRVNQRVYETFSISGESDHETGRRLKFRVGQLVRRSQIDNLFADASVASVTPSSGVAAGGTAVTIKGDRLSGVEGVLFGGVAATGVEVVDDETVRCTTPAHAAGAVDVVVQDDAGDVTESLGFTYTA